jgi:hypothetical protein
LARSYYRYTGSEKERYKPDMLPKNKSLAELKHDLAAAALLLRIQTTTSVTNGDRKMFPKKLLDSYYLSILQHPGKLLIACRYLGHVSLLVRSEAVRSTASEWAHAFQ